MLNRKIPIQIPIWFSLLAMTAVLAADVFEPSSQPYGYQAPIALSRTDVNDGTAVAYVPWFESSGFTGELLAAPVSSQGVVDYFAPIWRASEILPTQYWHLGRAIVTLNSETDSGVPFRFALISEDQQDEIGGEPVLNYVRGDRSGEGPSGLRERSRILGDIIHSNPTYVGKPKRGYQFDNYLGFAVANRNRAGRVYVGSNDGMLHAFNADTGNEEFAYIPSMLIAKLPQQAQAPFAHNYMVDGPLVAEDAYFGGAWHSVLVGGLGAGGMGLFALDVTSPTILSELDAASRILWEFTADDTQNLGYTYARPSLVKLNNGRWAVVVGNGYMSESGKAALLIIDVATGDLIREIVVDDNEDNGLSSPAVIDTNGDFKADVAYAGDLNGNLWKFDLGAASPSDWSTAWDKKPLFVTEEDNGTNLRQPITTAPTVGLHPEGGYFVYVATGQLLSEQDALGDYAVAPQAVYGIWDNGITDDSILPIVSANLLQQALKVKFHPADAESVRTATAHAPDWEVHLGWATSLDAAGMFPGTRVLTNHVLRNGRIQFTSVDVTTGSGNNYLMQLNAYTGGAPASTVIDVNADGSIGIADNVDGDGNGEVENSAADRVVGQYLGFGTASEPMVANIGNNDAAIVNKMYAVLAFDDPHTEVSGDEEDPGLVGGHIDLDTSHEIYDFDDGETDNHEHEWDDKHDATVVNFFEILGGGFTDIDEPTMPPAYGSETFIINVANAHLSPGAVIEINGASLPVKEYRAKTKRYLTGNLGDWETFPRYKLTQPTPAELAAGVVKLTDFRISFAKDGLLLGGVHPTNTGCVKGNEPGQHGEYRNGALTVQALDAANTYGGHWFNTLNSAYETVSHAIHEQGYAVSRSGSNDGSLFWEATIFWHWSGDCYGPDDADNYNAQFAEEVTDVDRGTDADISEDPPEPPDPGDGDDDTDDPSTDDVLGPPNAGVSTTEIAGESAGRLSWRELIIDE